MRVLVACEFSGVVRDAFRRKGHAAWSCDLHDVEPEGEYLQYHLLGDCLDYMHEGWDMLIAHPPCTYLANSGVRWLYHHDGAKNAWRWYEMACAARFFRAMLQAPVQRICVENPIMHGHAKDAVGCEQTQIIQPWQFGHGETKATCLWLKGLPPLVPTDIVEGRTARIHRTPDRKSRSKDRSRTLPGIAEAMAQQWG